LGDEAGTTMFMTVLSVFNILLCKLSNQDDVTIGTPVAGRDHSDLENIVGMFSNTLAIRNKLHGGLTFKEFLQNVREKCLSCFENQSYPYVELIEALKVPRDTSRNPLFDVMFTFENFKTEPIGIAGLHLKPFASSYKSSKFDLELIATEVNDELFFTLDYATDLFRRPTVERFANYFKSIVATVVNNANTQLSRIDILDAAERERYCVSSTIQNLSFLSMKRLLICLNSRQRFRLVRLQ
jgi:non-ribosomal peptide synthetase component F